MTAVQVKLFREQTSLNSALTVHCLYTKSVNTSLSGDYSYRRIFKPSKKSKLFKASKEFHSSDYFQDII